MWAYIYRSKIFDIQDKITGCTGITPVFVKSAWVPEVALIYDNQLSVYEKNLVDEFMRTREMVFHRLDESSTQISGSIGAAFEPKYTVDKYSPSGRLISTTEFSSKNGNEYTNKRKEILYTYSNSGNLLSEIINIYDNNGNIEDSRTFEFTTDKTLSITVIKKEGI